MGTLHRSHREEWRAKLWSAFVRLESTPLDDEFFGEIETLVPDTNVLSRVYSTAQITERTRAHIHGDPQDVVLLMIQETGTGFVEQDGRQAQLFPGDFTFYDTDRPYKLQFDRPFHQTVLRLSRQRLLEIMPTFNRTTACRFEGKTGPGRVAVGFVRELAGAGNTLGAAGLNGFEAATLQIFSTAILMSRNGAQDRQQARLENLKRKIFNVIRDPELDLEAFAKCEGISIRNLQRLFQVEGKTPREWVLEQRLAGISRDLRSPAQSARTVTEIAFGWGFNELSYFSRSFRARYGISAREWRQRD